MYSTGSSAWHSLMTQSQELGDQEGENICIHTIHSHMASMMVQQVKNLRAMQETQEMRVRSLGQEDPLEKEVATHVSILAWRIPRTEVPGGPPSMGSQRVGYN